MMRRVLLRSPRSHTRRAASSSGMLTGQRIVAAVGGNALQRRGDRLTIENMLKAAKQMVPAISAIRSAGNEVVLTHGNGARHAHAHQNALPIAGPQVGELALERSNASFDVLGAESQGQIGYVLSQAFQSAGVNAAAIVTQTLVDAADPAFSEPMKFVGPVYGFKEAEALAKSLEWTLDAVKALLDAGQFAIAAGGGGAPVSRVFGDIVGVEGVVDKDATAALMAESLGANGLIILTDGGGIWERFGKPDGREMRMVTPQFLVARKSGQAFPGSMGPKVNACIDFVTRSAVPGAWAIIGDLNDAAELMAGTKGTLIKEDLGPGGGDVVWYDREDAEAAAEKGPRPPRPPRPTAPRPRRPTRPKQSSRPRGPAFPRGGVD
ncbi:hypothetical protein JL720_14981 [Aureococcus anophagefferens]|nr:hypothetical protein JL720_14981 [Aureococcus anophagefferens]